MPKQPRKEDHHASIHVPPRCLQVLTCTSYLENFKFITEIILSILMYQLVLYANYSTGICMLTKIDST